MFIPAPYTWLEPVIIGAILVFIIDLIGNMLSFSNKYLNALVTALVFAAIFAGLLFTGIGRIEVRKADASSVAVTRVA